ncbi:MAG: phospho-sugar mutase [Christensenellaceae bacterium]|jgi:phosphoglucomutase|nr:phospho-sugar mutase [Christensenellaceae bacterium]
MDPKQIYNIWRKSVSRGDSKQLAKIEDNLEEIEDRFSTELEFGTAGMRGELGLGPARMNVYSVRRATQGIAMYIRELGDNAKKRGVVIAYDTRHMSREFAFEAAQVLSLDGIKVNIFEDVRPVPMLSFAVRFYEAMVGIMITASHNPKEYNGYKVYGEDGAQMSPEATSEVVKYIEQQTWFRKKANASAHYGENTMGVNNILLDKNTKVVSETPDNAYYETVSKLTLSNDTLNTFKGYNKIVYSPIHGSGKVPVITMLKKMGVDFAVVKEQLKPDPDFSTVLVPNPENQDTMNMAIELASKLKSELAMATDPDCDRLGVAVLNKYGVYTLLTGNQIGVLLLDYILMRLSEQNMIPKNGAVVRSLVSTSLADKIARGYGVTPFSVPTGFKFIGEKIKEWEISGEYEYIFGFEESFGTLRGTHARDKDAVVGCMLVAEMYIYYKSIKKQIYERLIELFEKYGYYVEKNITTVYKGIHGMKEMAEVIEKIRNLKINSIAGNKIISVSDYKTGFKTNVANGITEPLNMPISNMIYWELEDGQFICIRPSGTEPKLKIYVLACAENKKIALDKAELIGEETQKLCQ